MQIQKVAQLDLMMPDNRCYFRVTFNIFLYIVLTPKYNLIQIYTKPNQKYK